MNVNAYHNGTEITNEVTSYNRDKAVCSSVGTATVELINTGRTFDPYSVITIYEGGNLKGTYFVITVQERPGEVVLNCQDGSKKLVDYFIADYYEIDYPSTALYWLDKFMNEAGVSYSFDATGDGGLLSNNTALGRTSAMEAITLMLQIGGWYMYFDASNVAHITKLELDVGSYDETIGDSGVLELELNRDDAMMRNRVVVWGNGDPVTGEWLFVDLNTTVPEQRDEYDIRTILISNSGIKDIQSASTLANKALTEFQKPTYVKMVQIPGYSDRDITDVVYVNSAYFNGICLVTSINVNMSKGGFFTVLGLDERCPKLVGNYFDFGGNVYAGTDGAGIYTKNISYNHVWSGYSTGITDLNIDDLYVNQGLLVTTTQDGHLYTRGINDLAWTRFTPANIEDEDGNTYSYSDGYFVGCTIDKVTNLAQATFVVASGVSGGVLNSLATIASGAKSWLFDITSPSTYTSKQVVYSGTGNNIVTLDVDRNNTDSYLTCAIIGSGVGGVWSATFAPEETYLPINDSDVVTYPTFTTEEAVDQEHALLGDDWWGLHAYYNQTVFSVGSLSVSKYNLSDMTHDTISIADTGCYFDGASYQGENFTIIDENKILISAIDWDDVIKVYLLNFNNGSATLKLTVTEDTFAESDTNRRSIAHMCNVRVKDQVFLFFAADGSKYTPGVPPYYTNRYYKTPYYIYDTNSGSITGPSYISTTHCLSYWSTSYAFDTIAIVGLDTDADDNYATVFTLDTNSLATTTSHLTTFDYWWGAQQIVPDYTNNSFLILFTSQGAGEYDRIYELSIPGYSLNQIKSYLITDSGPPNYYETRVWLMLVSSDKVYAIQGNENSSYKDIIDVRSGSVLANNKIAHDWRSLQISTVVDDDKNFYFWEEYNYLKRYNLNTNTTETLKTDLGHGWTANYMINNLFYQTDTTIGIIGPLDTSGSGSSSTEYRLLRNTDQEEFEYVVTLPAPGKVEISKETPIVTFGNDLVTGSGYVYGSRFGYSGTFFNIGTDLGSGYIYDVRIFDLLTSLGSSRCIGVTLSGEGLYYADTNFLLNGYLTNINGKFYNGGEEVSWEDSMGYLQFTPYYGGAARSFETSNYYDTPYMFLSFGGLVYQKDGYYLGEDETLFVDRSVGLPGNTISVIRLDDML